MARITKADPLYDRMLHAFGQRSIDFSFQTMLTARNCDLIDLLTDDARDELIRRCIRSHKLQRRYAAESRKLRKSRVA
jgi:hypothetical protein